MWMRHSGASEKKRNSNGEYQKLADQLEMVPPDVKEQIEKVCTSKSLLCRLIIARTCREPFPLILFSTKTPLDTESFADCCWHTLCIIRRLNTARYYFSVGPICLIFTKGMNFVAGYLLLFMHEEDAFWTLDAIVEDILPNYYDTHLGGLQVQLLSRNEPC